MDRLNIFSYLLYIVFAFALQVYGSAAYASSFAIHDISLRADFIGVISVAEEIAAFDDKVLLRANVLDSAKGDFGEEIMLVTRRNLDYLRSVETYFLIGVMRELGEGSLEALGAYESVGPVLVVPTGQQGLFPCIGNTPDIGSWLLVSRPNLLFSSVDLMDRSKVHEFIFYADRIFGIVNWSLVIDMFSEHIDLEHDCRMK